MKMTYYLGTKPLLAGPMPLGVYNTMRGWDLPDNESAQEEGYLVEYLDGGEGNHPDHKGYISWSPKDVFESAYRGSGNMSFGHALEALKSGKRVSRTGWNGKGMFLFLVPGSTFTVNRPPLLGIYPEGKSINYHAHIDMKTATDEVVPWLCSQSDALADDWCVLNDVGT